MGSSGSSARTVTEHPFIRCAIYPRQSVARETDLTACEVRRELCEAFVGSMQHEGCAILQLTRSPLSLGKGAQRPGLRRRGVGRRRVGCDRQTPYPTAEPAITACARAGPVPDKLLRKLQGRKGARSKGSTSKGRKEGALSFRGAQGENDLLVLGSSANCLFVDAAMPHAVGEFLTGLERFIHGERHLQPLVRAGLCHAQLETIHPTLDGDGRIGRLLIALLLEHWKLLREPLLYLSLFFKQQHHAEY